MNFAIVWVALAVFVLFVGLVFWLLYRYDRSKEAERIAKDKASYMAEAIAEQERELRRQVELAEKTEVIRHEQTENRDRAADFDGSIDVLSDIAARGRKDR